MYIDRYRYIYLIWSNNCDLIFESFLRRGEGGGLYVKSKKGRKDLITLLDLGLHLLVCVISGYTN